MAETNDCICFLSLYPLQMPGRICRVHAALQKRSDLHSGLTPEACLRTGMEETAEASSKLQDRRTRIFSRVGSTRSWWVSSVPTGISIASLLAALLVLEPGWVRRTLPSWTSGAFTFQVSARYPGAHTCAAQPPCTKDNSGLERLHTLGSQVAAAVRRRKADRPVSVARLGLVAHAISASNGGIRRSIEAPARPPASQWRIARSRSASRIPGPASWRGDREDSALRLPRRPCSSQNAGNSRIPKTKGPRMLDDVGQPTQ